MPRYATAIAAMSWGQLPCHCVIVTCWGCRHIQVSTQLTDCENRRHDTLGTDSFWAWHYTPYYQFDKGQSNSLYFWNMRQENSSTVCVCLSIHLPIRPSKSRCFSLFICFSPSVCLSIHSSHLSVYPAVFACLSACQSNRIAFPSTSLSVSICLCHPFVSLYPSFLITQACIALPWHVNSRWLYQCMGHESGLLPLGKRQAWHIVQVDVPDDTLTTTFTNNPRMASCDEKHTHTSPLQNASVSLGQPISREMQKLVLVIGGKFSGNCMHIILVSQHT